jgi:hypothetical protein
MTEIVDPKTGLKINLIDPDKPKSIFDPNSEFMRELEIYKLKSEIKPRKSRMMEAQSGWIADMCKPVSKPIIHIPDGKGGFI